jgi:hypothetical protein
MPNSPSQLQPPSTDPATTNRPPRAQSRSLLADTVKAVSALQLGVGPDSDGFRWRVSESFEARQPARCTSQRLGRDTLGASATPRERCLAGSSPLLPPSFSPHGLAAAGTRRRPTGARKSDWRTWRAAGAAPIVRRRQTSSAAVVAEGVR